MMTRRSFLKTGAAVCVAGSIPERSSISKQRTTGLLQPQQPQKAVVIWFSQTGHTGRIGRLIAREWESKGLEVDSGDYRKLGSTALTQYDLIAMGSPVNYYGIAINMKEWLKKIELNAGTPVASFVTYGGEGGNQHNTACSLLELMAEKGGIPVGMETFGNMSTFAPTWSLGNEKRILKYKDLPNEATYKKARRYARDIHERVQKGESCEIDPEFSFEDWFKHGPSIWGTKLLIGRHTIDTDKCIGCGTCEDLCPSGAIQLHSTPVDTKRCVACLGCVNNCPAQAIDMTFMGRKVYGFQDFLKKHEIQNQEPEAFDAI